MIPTNLFVMIPEPLRDGVLYVYDGSAECLVKFEPRPESWASWLGKQAASGTMVVLTYYVLKWVGVIVVVNVAVQS